MIATWFFALEEMSEGEWHPKRCKSLMLGFSLFNRVDSFAAPIVSRLYKMDGLSPAMMMAGWLCGEKRRRGPWAMSSQLHMATKEFLMAQSVALCAVTVSQ